MEDVNDLLKNAKESLVMTENESDTEITMAYSNQSIAYSLLAIAKMMHQNQKSEDLKKVLPK